MLQLPLTRAVLTPGRGRRRAPVFLVILLGLGLVAGSGRATAQAADDPAGEAAPSTSATIAIPYLGASDLTPAAGWTIADCGIVNGQAPNLPGVSLACDSAGIGVTASVFDAEWGMRTLTVGLQNGAVRVEVDYRVVLEPPPAPSLTDLDYGYPVAQGAVLLLPLGALGVTCTLCTTASGAEVEVLGLSPQNAGLAAVSGTHLVLRTAPDFTGTATVQVGLVDDAGQSSEPVEVTVHIAPGSGTTAALGALHVVMDRGPDATTVIDLAAISWNDTGSDLLVACGEATFGTVQCTDDLAAVYTPSPGASVDQFSFQVVSVDGQQASGSVTLVADGVTEPPLGISPVATAATEPLLVTPRVPVPGAAETGANAGLSYLSALLATIGTRS
ncbi:hypothetical protein E3O06_00845 [Cryobacterium glaciale]|uniref:Uncharacterized protein n=1 Tax=Cryobacterium glaciale TaxID=1259145 RepID=A0A4R8V3W6_9MICO|nr:hypothetical protein [Cryobacterium glaciale]TFB77333.1 hypothetical protein E3O06_00845 [Cryobacterium glaciale]